MQISWRKPICDSNSFIDATLQSIFAMEDQVVQASATLFRMLRSEGYRSVCSQLMQLRFLSIPVFCGSTGFPFSMLASISRSREGKRK